MRVALAAALAAMVAGVCGGGGDGRVVAVGDPDRPSFIGCQTSQECGKGACCVLGMSRYSTPRCVPHRELGQGCRPGAEAEPATTLHYPNGVSVDMADVYFIHCPCQEGLRCDGAAAGDSPVCADDAPPTNALDLELEHADAGAGAGRYSYPYGYWQR